MTIRELKPYILSVLIAYEGKLAIHPSLLIDDLIEQLPLDTLVAIGIYLNYLTPEDMSIVFDRHLAPTLMHPRFNVKILARS